MGNKIQEKETLLSQIHAIMTIIERNKLSLDMFENADISLSPLQLLLSIVKCFGITYGELVDFVSKYIVVVTPIIELTLKGILLSRFKSNIDCNIDPRIPLYLREEISGFKDMENTSYKTRGLVMDLSTLDYYGMLNLSPMSYEGRYKYFGVNYYYQIKGIAQEKFYEYEEAIKYCQKYGIDALNVVKYSDIDSIYELVRPRDLNAFLWFVLHKASFVTTNELLSSNCILKTIIENTEDDSSMSLGQCYTQKVDGKQYNVMGLCIKRKVFSNNVVMNRENATSNDNDNEINDVEIGHTIQNIQGNENVYEYTIVPTTNIWNGCNWYVDRTRYWNLSPFKTERNYDKEFALFRLSTIKNPINHTTQFAFTIKPSPSIITPSLDVKLKIKQVENIKDIFNKNTYTYTYNGDMPWKFIRVIFNEEGKQDFFGKYSVEVGDKILEGDAYDKLHTQWGDVYEVLDVQTKKATTIYLCVNEVSLSYQLIGLNREDIRSVLYECYPGLTLYEFNYDFVMGMQLFDSTVLSAQLIDMITNIRIKADFNQKQSDYRMRISEIVKKIMEAHGHESSDCFYTFSNIEYDNMQDKSELQRLRLYKFNDERNQVISINNNTAYDILNECVTNTTLEENISVVTRSLNSVSANIRDEILPKTEMEMDFITQCIEAITSVFVESLLTPKFLMIFYINQKLMGEDSKVNWDIDYLLDAFWNIIGAFIVEMSDMLIKKLLDFVIEKTKELLMNVSVLLIKEQLDYYFRLMTQIINNCTFRLPSNPNLVSTLDVVNYADIDGNENLITNEC